MTGPQKERVTISSLQVLASLLSGTLINAGGWHLLNYLSLVCIALIAAGLLWLGAKQSSVAVSVEAVQ